MTKNLCRKTRLSVRHYSRFVPNIDKEYFDLLPVHNERLLNYETGSEERSKVKLALADILQRIESVPIVIDGQEMHNNSRLVQQLPYNKNHYIAR